MTDTVEVKPFVASGRRSEVATKLAARAKESPAAAHAKGIATRAGAKPSAKTVEKQIKEVNKDEIDKHKDAYKEAKEHKEYKDAKENKEHKESKENKESKETKEIKEFKEHHKEILKEHVKELIKDQKDAKEHKENKDGKDSADKDQVKDQKDGNKEGDKDDKDGEKDGEKDDDKDGDKDGDKEDEDKFAIDEPDVPHRGGRTRAAAKRPPGRSAMRPSSLLVRPPVV